SCLRKTECGIEMAGRIMIPTRISREFTEQAMGAEEGERLTGFGGMRERLLRLCVRFVALANLPVVARPQHVARGLATDRPTPRQPAAECVDPFLCLLRIARVQEQHRADLQGFARVCQRSCPGFARCSLRQPLPQPLPYRFPRPTRPFQIAIGSHRRTPPG